VAPQPIPTSTIQQVVEVADATVAAQATTTVSTPEKKDPLVEAYELGKAVGKLQGQAETMAIVASSTPTPVPQPIIQPTMTETSPTPSTEPTAPVAEAPASQARIEIINYIPGKGLGREYKAAPEIVDESNYIEIGAVVYNADGSDAKDATVTITATDESQNKVLNGTGDINRASGNHYYFAFHYEFKTAGDHTITFSANDITKSVTVNVK
jgi:hypothetical protein